MVDVDFILHVSVYDFDKYWYNIRKNKIPGYSTFEFCPNINLIVACYYSVTNIKHHTMGINTSMILPTDIKKIPVLEFQIREQSIKMCKSPSEPWCIEIEPSFYVVGYNLSKGEFSQVVQG